MRNRKYAENKETNTMGVNRLSIIKFLELALAIVCLGLHYKSVTGNVETDIVSAAAFGGFVVILLGGFVGHLVTSPITRRIDIYFCLAGCALFVAAGALNIQHYDNYWKGETRDYGLAKASLAIINGAIFLVDSLLTWRGDW